MNYFRKRNAAKWQKKVDIGVLYRLEKHTGQLKKLVEKEISDEELEKRCLEEIEQLEINLAVAQGKVKDFQLKKEQMPEDANPAEYRKSGKPKKSS